MQHEPPGFAVLSQWPPSRATARNASRIEGRAASCRPSTGVARRIAICRGVSATVAPTSGRSRARCRIRSSCQAIGASNARATSNVSRLSSCLRLGYCATGLQAFEEFFDEPARAIPLHDPQHLLGRGDRFGGDQRHSDRWLAVRWMHLGRVHHVDGERAGQRMAMIARALELTAAAAKRTVATRVARASRRFTNGPGRVPTCRADTVTGRSQRASVGWAASKVAGASGCPSTVNRRS